MNEGTKFSNIHIASGLHDTDPVLLAHTETEYSIGIVPLGYDEFCFLVRLAEEVDTKAGAVMALPLLFKLCNSINEAIAEAIAQIEIWANKDIPRQADGYPAEELSLLDAENLTTVARDAEPDEMYGDSDGNVLSPEEAAAREKAMQLIQQSGVLISPWQLNQIRISSSSELN